MGCILSWREFFKIHAVKEETANGFRIHGPRAGKTTSDKGKKAAAAAAANWVFQQWRWRWHLCIWSKWGLEGFSQFSSSLLWSWRALRCYTEGDIVTHPLHLTVCGAGGSCEFGQGCGSHRMPVGSEPSLDILLVLFSFVFVCFLLFRNFTTEM